MFALLQWPQFFADPDNTPALCSYVAGSDRAADIVRTVHVFYMLCTVLRCRVWWEWVKSDANWADGASRLLFEDGFARRHRFSISALATPAWPWEMALPQLAKRVRAVVVGVGC